jgi:hypothetical protein
MQIIRKKLRFMDYDVATPVYEPSIFDNSTPIFFGEAGQHRLLV